jgi:hypothetical protein
MDKLRRHHAKHANYFYGTINEWVAASTDIQNQHPDNSTFYNRIGTSPLFKDKDWYGVSTIEELEYYLRSATYAPALALMEERVEKLAPLPTLKRKLVWDTQGAEVDRQRLYNGQSDYWRSIIKKPALGHPLITLNCQLFLNVNYTADEMIWRAVAALSFVRQAEYAGFRVQILASGYIKEHYVECVNGTNDIAAVVQIKAHNQPLNINTLACVLGFAGFLRYTLLKCVRTSANRVRANSGIPSNLDLSAHHNNYISLTETVRSQESHNRWLKNVRSTLLKIRQEFNK